MFCSTGYLAVWHTHTHFVDPISIANLENHLWVRARQSAAEFVPFELVHSQPEQSNSCSMCVCVCECVAVYAGGCVSSNYRALGKNKII